jgi:hypothetical protein
MNIILSPKKLLLIIVIATSIFVLLYTLNFSQKPVWSFKVERLNYNGRLAIDYKGNLLVTNEDKIFVFNQKNN